MSDTASKIQLLRSKGKDYHFIDEGRLGRTHQTYGGSGHNVSVY